MLGHKTGDTVTVKVSDEYSYKMEIRRIDKTVDDGSDDIRSF